MSKFLEESMEILDELERTAIIFRDSYWCVDIERIFHRLDCCV